MQRLTITNVGVWISVCILVFTAPAYAQLQGPDGGGYVVLSENITGTYPWQSISTAYGGTGTVIDWSTHKQGNNAYTDAVPLGFSFNYYGTAYTSIYIMSSGWLSFTDREYVLPDTSVFPYTDDVCAGVIAPFVMTFDNGQADGVYYQTLGTAPRRRFVVEWSDAFAKFNQDYHSFQAVFYEGSHQIEFLYSYVADYGNSSYPEPSHIGFESPDEQYGFDLGLFKEYNRPPYPTGESSRFLIGKQFVVSLGAYDGGGTASVHWDAVTDDPQAEVMLYYDDGTDTSGTLITGGLTAGDTAGYVWDVSRLAQGTEIYIYGVLEKGVTDFVSYAVNRLTPGVTIRNPYIADNPDMAFTVVPNPGRGIMAMDVPIVAGGRLTITTTGGDYIRTLGRTNGGFRWDGLDAAGRNIGAGVYIARMDNGMTHRIMRTE